MKKIGILGYIVLAIAFVAFSVIAFAAPFHKTTGIFWMGYLFGVIAIAFQIYVFKCAFSGNKDARSKFYGFPIIKVGIIYLIAQIIVSLVEMALAAYFPMWVAIIVNVILLAFASIGCIAASVVKEEVIRQDIKIERDTTRMRSLQKLSASLVELSSNPEIKGSVTKIAEEFRYSDPVSSENTITLEDELLEELEMVKKMISESKSEEVNRQCDKILQDLTNRNMVCARNK